MLSTPFAMRHTLAAGNCLANGPRDLDRTIVGDGQVSGLGALWAGKGEDHAIRVEKSRTVSKSTCTALRSSRLLTRKSNTVSHAAGRTFVVTIVQCFSRADRTRQSLSTPTNVGSCP